MKAEKIQTKPIRRKVCKAAEVRCAIPITQEENKTKE